MRPARGVLLCLAVLLASVSALSAQKNHQAPSAVTSKDKQTTFITHSSAPATPYVDENAGATIIFSNLALAYPKGLYWCCQGATVSGPNSPFFVEWWHAAPFTPAANATAKKIVVSLGYLGGDGSVILSLNADNNGLPGAVLEHWTLSNLGEAGTCCTVQSANSAGVPLTAGQQYWIVASTTSASNVWAEWNQADNDQVDSFLNAGYTNQNSNGWVSSTGNLNVVFGVFGQ